MPTGRVIAKRIWRSLTHSVEIWHSVVRWALFWIVNQKLTVKARSNASVGLNGIEVTNSWSGIRTHKIVSEIRDCGLIEALAIGKPSWEGIEPYLLGKVWPPASMESNRHLGTEPVIRLALAYTTSRQHSHLTVIGIITVKRDNHWRRSTITDTMLDS
jgi:hypothetical protein